MDDLSIVIKSLKFQEILGVLVLIRAVFNYAIYLCYFWDKFLEGEKIISSQPFEKKNGDKKRLY